MAYCFLGLAFALATHARGAAELAVARSRNFYGVVTVYRYAADTPDERFTLRHGRVGHGVQFTAPDRRSRPTAYYAPNSGAGLALRYWPQQENRRIGMVGMGVGTLAAYARPSDYVRIYEIDPQVVHLADTYFTFLKDSPARIDVVMGDARLSLEREAPQRFDLLLLDAFTGDAIPLHLLTTEAFEIYQRHLEPDGVIALLIDRWHLDFGPVVRRLADHLGLESLRIATPVGALEDWGADWMLMTKNRAFLDQLPDTFAVHPDESAADPGAGRRDDGPLWTDDYASLFRLLWN